MRRIACLLLVAALIMSMIFSASAISYSDRGRYYLYVTSSSTAMFSQSTQTDENGNTTSILSNIGTLPAGTPISAGEIVDDIYQKVVYMDQSAATHTVIISKDVVKGNYVTLDFGGSIGKVRIPRPAAANASFVKEYLTYRGISASDEDISNALGIYTTSVTEAPVSPDQVAEQNDTFSTPAGTADPSSTPAPDAGSKDSSSGSKKSTAKATKAPVREAVEADGLVIDHLDFLHILVVAGDLGFVGRIHDGFDGELDVIRGERFAVVPGDAFPQMEGICVGVFCGRQR